MSEYKVVWTIDVEADSPKQAAEEALQIMLDNEQATFFEIEEEGVKVAEVDLYEETLKIMDKQVTDYLKAGGMGCPHCKHEETTCLGGSIEADETYETYVCDKCKKTWTDVSKLVSVDLHV